MPMPLMWIDKVTLESLARHRFRRLRTSVVFSPHLHHTLQGRLVARLSLKIPNAARPSKHTDSALPCTATANSNASRPAHEGLLWRRPCRSPEPRKCCASLREPQQRPGEKVRYAEQLGLPRARSSQICSLRPRNLSPHPSPSHERPAGP